MAEDITVFTIGSKVRLTADFGPGSGVEGRVICYDNGAKEYHKGSWIGIAFSGWNSGHTLDGNVLDLSGYYSMEKYVELVSSGDVKVSISNAFDDVFEQLRG